MTKAKGKVLGIDLGTTNSCMAIMEAGQPTVIPNNEGARTTPSVVFLGEDKSVGQIAKRQRVLKPKQTVYSAKRLIGHTWQETEKDRGNLAYETVEGKNNSVNIRVDGKDLTPQCVFCRHVLLHCHLCDEQDRLHPESNNHLLTTS